MDPKTLDEPWRDEMTRETIVQLFGAVVFAATLLVTVLAVVHLFSS
jgi:hypothetical protein